MDNRLEVNIHSAAIETREVVGYLDALIKAPDLAGITDSAANLRRIADELDRLATPPPQQRRVDPPQPPATRLG